MGQKGKSPGVYSIWSGRWNVEARDKYIGWPADEKERNLKKIANHQRFLLLKSVPNLASYVLSPVCQRIGGDFINKYGHKVVLLETFVEKERFFVEYADETCCQVEGENYWL
jgi:hypothetical protein